MKEPQKNGEFILIFAFVGLIVTLYVLDLRYGTEIRAALIRLYGYELTVLQPIARYVFGLDYGPLIAYTRAPPESFWSDVLYIANHAHAFWRYPVLLLIGFFAYRSLKKMPKMAPFSRHLDLESFMALQATYWKFTLPFVRINLLKSKDANWAPASYPNEWIAANGLDNGKYSENLIRQSFASQLRMPWDVMADGFDKLPLHVRFLFAVFALKAGDNCNWQENHPAPKERDVTRRATQHMLFDVGEEYAKLLKLGPVTESWIERVLAKDGLRGRLVLTCRQHAYVETALIACFATAKLRGGVFAPAEFAWLKGIDRTLWYVVHGHGSRTFFSECAGVHAHYMGELAAKSPITRPFVDTAVDSMVKWADENAYESV